MPARHTFFTPCAPGIEPVLHEEARALGLARIERQVGGVRFEGTMADAWRANLWLRTAIRVLRRLARFPAENADDLYRGASGIDWSAFLAPGATLAVDAQTRESSLDHSRFIEQRVKDAVVDQLRELRGTRPSVDRDDPDLRIHAHVFRNRVTLSLDTSGSSLHKRGWRRYQGRAPLAETLAAAIVLLSRWDRRAPLLDPFCGSGTILIEAALLACDAAPGLLRERFGFERWPDHDADGWRAAKAEARRARKRPPRLTLYGWDRDRERLEGARTNARAAGVDELIELAQADVRDFAPRRGWNAWIVTNPPYGERVGREAELLPLYLRFGEVLSDRCGGSHLALLSGNPRLAKALKLGKTSRERLMNGALDCELLRVEIGDR